MPILVNCPSCATKYNAPDSAVGKSLKCKKCSTTIKIENATDQQIQDWLGSPSIPPARSSSPLPPLIQIASPQSLEVPQSEWSLPKQGLLRVFAPLSVVLATVGFVYWPAGILGLSIATGCLAYYEIMNPAQAKLGKVFAFVAIFLGGLGFVTELMSFDRAVNTSDFTEKTPQTVTPSVSSASPAPVAKWYVGGTLHRATMREWRLATYENKLATAGDFLTANLLKAGGDPSSIDLEGFVRPAAIGFVADMEVANKDGPADDMQVSEVAATLFAITKENLRKRRAGD